MRRSLEVLAGYFRTILGLRLLILAVILCAQEIPPHSGPDHQGQPEWCQSGDRGGYSHNCSCRGMTNSEGQGMCDERGKPDPHGDSKCRTYCRRKACTCHVECEKPSR